jgi:hypothetical protein
MVKSVLHLANQVVMAKGRIHGPPILARPGDLAPQQGSQFSSPHLTHTLEPHRGNTMYLYSPKLERIIYS